MDGTVKCWGRNGAGQLGNGMTMDSARPVQVMGLTTARSVSAGYEHACAVLADGTARCWGLNSTGQLGNGTMMNSLTPVTVMGLSNVASIHAGVFITCALLTDRTVQCWGRGGELGTGTLTASQVPVVVPGLTDVLQLSVAPNPGTGNPIQVCGVRMNGTVFCWGQNNDGQLGDGTQDNRRVPTNVMGITDGLEVTAGGTHACARRTSGLSCWGTAPQIGDGTVNRKFVPTPVDTNPMVNAIEAGHRVTLARTSTNALICWGHSGLGTCGDGAAFTPGGPSYSSPIASLVTKADLFVVGGNHACAYDATTSLTRCWGQSFAGELGYELPSTVSRTSTPDFVRW